MAELEQAGAPQTPDVDPKILASIPNMLEGATTPLPVDAPVTPEPVEVVEQPPPPKFSYDSMIAARQAGYSEDEIKSFSSEYLLRDAVSGRRAIAEAEIAARERASQPKPPPQAREFKLALKEEELDETVSGPLKTLAEEVQLLHRELASERAARLKLEERHSQTQGQLQQRAVQEALNTLESVVSSMPELSSRLGRLSDVMNDPTSEQHLRWQMIAPAIQARLNGKPLTVENTKGALLEAARVLGWMTRENNTGNGKAPGHVFASSRRTVEQPPPTSATGMNERERVINEVRQIMGGVI